VTGFYCKLYDFAYLAIFAAFFTILGAFASRIALRKD